MAMDRSTFRLISFVILTFPTCLTEGSHFRGGIITWRPLTQPDSSPNQPSFLPMIEISYRLAWRRSSSRHMCDDQDIASRTVRSGGESFSCNCSGFSHMPSYICTDYSVTEDWTTGINTVQYQPNVTHFEIWFAGAGWINLLNSGRSNWDLGASVDLTVRSDNGRINSSPTTTTMPIVRLQRECNTTIKIPVLDADGDDVRCFWATRRCGGICNRLPGAALIEKTCQLLWNITPSVLSGLYGVAIEIQDFSTATSNEALSVIPLQFIVDLFSSTRACVSQPMFIPPTRVQGSCIGIPTNNTYHESIIARAGSPGVSILDIHTLSPSGLLKSSVRPYPGGLATDYYVNITWTPQTIGIEEIFCFVARDNAGFESLQSCVTLVTGTQPPQIKVSSLNPANGSIVLINDLTVQFQIGQDIVRPIRPTFIRVFSHSDTLVYQRNAQLYQQVDFRDGNIVAFTIPMRILEVGISYYILMDPGVARSKEFCGVESPRVDDVSFWTFVGAIDYFEYLEDRLRITANTAGNLTTEELEEALQFVKEVTEDPKFFKEDPGRIQLVGDSLETLVNVGDPSVNVTELVVQTVNNILDVDRDVIMNGTTQGGRIVAALEEQVANVQSNKGNFSRTLKNIGVAAVKIDKVRLARSAAFVNIFTDGTTLDADLGNISAELFVDGGDIPFDRITSFISVPTTALNQLENADVNFTEVPVCSFVYSNAVLFTPSRPTLIPDDANNEEINTNTSEILVSQVISVTIKTGGVSITKLPPGSENVITKFITNITLGVNETSEAKKCVFWSYDDRTGEGYWSEEGCETMEDKSEITVCSCDRLASFAVLVRVRKGPSPVALYYITLIGSIISGICLVLCIITFVTVKAYRSKQPTYIHLNLCLSLLGFYIVFLLSLLATGDKVRCAIASAAVHFFCLATVAWMSVEAVNMYYLFVKIGKTNIRYFISVACLLAYGFPAICVVLVAVLDRNSEFQSTDYCFIHPGPALYFGFLMEIAILFVLNFIIFILIVRKMLCRPLMVSRTRENARRNEIITRVRHGILFWFVLGLSWVFGFLSAVDGTLIFDYLYCIFIAAQGVMMFLLLCVANPEFRKVLVRHTGHTCTSQASSSRSASWKTASTSKLTVDSQTDIQLGNTESMRR